MPIARAAGLGGTTDNLPGKTKDDVNYGAPVRIDASSIAAMVQPSGVQQVQVTNPPQPPNVTINSSPTFNISGATSPEALARQTDAVLGEAMKKAAEGSYGYGEY